MKQLLPTLIVLTWAGILGCQKAATTHRIQFVDRDVVTSHSITTHPLMLIVEVDGTGRMRLNKIETGTTADMDLLAKKLKAIFADRERSGIDEREVLIDSRMPVETENYEELITVLADAKASPITIITNKR